MGGHGGRHRWSASTDAGECDMRGLLLGCALAVLPALWAGDAQGVVQAQQAQQAPPKLTFEGDVALWTVAVKPDKTADFETIMSKLREGLMKSARPERQKQ